MGNPVGLCHAPAGAQASRATHAGGIVLALSADLHYTLHGVTPGMRRGRRIARLKLGRATDLRRNWRYVVPGPDANWVLKTHHGVIVEIGLASKQLTATGFEQVRASRPLLSDMPGRIP